MTASIRTSLMTGVAAVGATAIVFAPLEVPPPNVTAAVERPATVRMMSDARVELLAAVRPMAATDAVTFNTASDFIINAWDAAVPWINYGVDLADYVLGFIPFGYLIGDQISIVWYDFGLPVSDSFVRDLVAPVVNDPLNGAVWFNGLSELGSTTVTSLINLGIAEFNYFFGWLIPPIPPLTLAAVPESAEEPAQLPAAEPEPIETEPVETEPIETEPVETEPIVETELVDETADENVADEVAEESEPEAEVVDTATEPTTDSNGTVSAQGEVRGSASDALADDTDETAADEDAADDSPVNQSDVTDPVGDAAQNPSDTDSDSASESDSDSDTGANGDGASE